MVNISQSVWVVLSLGAVLMMGVALVGFVESPYVAIALLSLAGFAHQTLSVTVITMSSDLFRRNEVATVAGMFSVVYSLRFTADVFFGPDTCATLHVSVAGEVARGDVRSPSGLADGSSSIPDARRIAGSPPLPLGHQIHQLVRGHQLAGKERYFLAHVPAGIGGA